MQKLQVVDNLEKLQLQIDQEFINLDFELEAMSPSVKFSGIADVWKPFDDVRGYIMFAVETYKSLDDEDFDYTITKFKNEDPAVPAPKMFLVQGLVAVRKITDDFNHSSIEDFKKSFNALCSKYKQDPTRLWSLEIYIGSSAYTIIPILDERNLDFGESNNF